MYLVSTLVGSKLQGKNILSSYISTPVSRNALCVANGAQLSQVFRVVFHNLNYINIIKKVFVLFTLKGLTHVNIQWIQVKKKYGNNNETNLTIT